MKNSNLRALIIAGFMGHLLSGYHYHIENRRVASVDNDSGDNEEISKAELKRDRKRKKRAALNNVEK